MMCDVMLNELPKNWKKNRQILNRRSLEEILIAYILS